VRNFRAAPEWRLAVRILVERLVEDIHDPDLRLALDAGATIVVPLTRVP